MNDKTRPKGITGDSYMPARQRSDRKRQSAGFTTDAGLEHLLELRRTDPRAFARLGVNIRMAVGYYTASKATFEKEHRDGNANG